MILMAERLLCENCCNPYKAPTGEAKEGVEGVEGDTSDVNISHGIAVLPPHAPGTVMQGQLGEDDESKYLGVTVALAAQLREAAIRHPQIQSDLVTPTTQRMAPLGRPFVEEVQPVEKGAASGARPKGTTMTAVSTPLGVAQAAATAFDPQNPQIDSVAKKAKAAPTAAAASAVAPTGELSEEDKIRIEIERVKRLLFKMDVKELMEIRGYPRPPAGLEPLLRCNLVLLGNKEAELKTWVDIKKKIVKVGTCLRWKV